jgi:[ribosomal protein S5]-alanine N-acetyltransferase
MQPPIMFTTRRLLLRQPQLDDALPIFTTYAQDPDVTRYLVWRPHTSVANTEAFLECCLRGWQHGTEYTYVITDAQSHHLFGMVSLRLSGFAASLGYVLARHAWGQAIMAEAIQPVIDWTLNLPAIFRVWAVCDVDNRASARVMEKVGMHQEGLMRRGVLHPNISSEPRDCWLYARVK